MLRRNLTAAASLLVLLVLLEHFGLERTAEKKLEDRYTRLAELPATSALPSYLASLFLGSFRVVVVDALWIEASRMREEEHRYYETIEIMSFISVLQPRNPEVWAQQAQDAGWNIANPTRDPERRWEWIKFAFKTLERGILQLPDNPYLKHEMVRLLLQKPTVRNGVYDTWLLDHIEEDPAIQELLHRLCPGMADPEGPETAFDFAAELLRRAGVDMMAIKERDGFRYYAASTGYNLSHSTIDGYRRLAFYHQGHRLWQKGRLKEAAAAFRTAAELSKQVLEVHKLPIYAEYGKLDAGCAEIVDQIARTGGASHAESLRAIEALLRRTRQADFGFLAAVAGELKRSLGGDASEWNDDADRSTDLRPNQVLSGTIAPDPDTDMYGVPVHPPEGDRAFERRRIRIALRNDGDRPLLVLGLSPTDLGPKETIRRELPPKQDLELGIDVDRPGYAFVVLTAAALPGPAPAYRIAWIGLD